MIEKQKEKSKKDKIRRDIETIERHRVDQLKLKGWFRNFERSLFKPFSQSWQIKDVQK